ncbi:unnamed protein product [Fraxinus pennsylvanica]|uniref:Uncharacterized protein n=1 Tax=Fraxinus pennsylvanica TaxID=56036 RepID=A0AAD2A000_9LAMI|nr:unnamed protein product [Fraxinus pennsylvanica]
MEEFDDVDQQTNALSLIDLDCQFSDTVSLNCKSENQTEATTLQLSEAMGAQKEAFLTMNGDGNDQLPDLCEWTELESSQRNGRCNLRKSLAWDSAFFTSSGVLDPEELSSMLKGAGKAGKHLLPGIEEDIRKSTESISTLESDSLTLESLEDDLFADIRASIQRSSRRAFTMTNSGGNAVVIDNQAISCLRKDDLASENQLNPKPAVKKLIGMQAIRMPKCQGFVL